MFVCDSKKKESLPTIDRKSFNKAQSKIDKLRPFKDRIVLKIKHINGFAGCFISDKVRVLCITEEARKEIRSILNRYTTVEIINVNDVKKSDVIGKPKITFKSFKSTRDTITFFKNHVMTDLLRNKSS
jgi:hypothetical protein